MLEQPINKNQDFLWLEQNELNQQACEQYYQRREKFIEWCKNTAVLIENMKTAQILIKIPVDVGRLESKLNPWLHVWHQLITNNYKSYKIKQKFSVLDFEYHVSHLEITKN